MFEIWPRNLSPNPLPLPVRPSPKIPSHRGRLRLPSPSFLPSETLASPKPSAMAAPFPTSDPLCLQIIANVLYGLPPAPPGYGPQDGGAQAQRAEVLRPGCGGEARGYAPPPEVPRPGRGEEGRADAPPPELRRPGRGGEARGYAPRPEVPRPGRGEEGRADAPPPEVCRPGCGREGRGDAPQSDVSRSGRGGEARGDAPLQQCSSRCGPTNLEGLSGVAGQERAVQGAKPGQLQDEGRGEGTKPRSSLGSDLKQKDEGREGTRPRSSLGRAFSCSRDLKQKDEGRECIRPRDNLERICSSSTDLKQQDEGREGSNPCSNLGGSLEEAPTSIIHDLQFLSFNKINEALDKAKGPVSVLRIDTILLDSEQLERLLKMLVGKKVREVILVNRKWPVAFLDFPMDRMDNTNVERLQVCFYHIPEIFASIFENLVLLDIAHCLITSDNLKDIVLKSKRLRELHLRYYKEDLHIYSRTLVTLQIWYSEMNLIEIHDAPQLQKIIVSAIPKSNHKLLLVRLNNSPNLRTIVGNVSNQSISIKCHDIRRGTSLMPTLRNLYIGVCLSVEKERKYLLSIFKCFTHLEKLVIWRMDDIASSEVFDAVIEDWPAELRVCEIVRHLCYLKMEGFKGGEFELSIASALLKHSPSLRDLVIVSDSAELLEKAKNAFQLPSHVTVIYQKSRAAGMKKQC